MDRKLSLLILSRRSGLVLELRITEFLGLIAILKRRFQAENWMPEFKGELRHPWIR